MNRRVLILTLFMASLAIGGIVSARGGAFNASRTFEFDPDHTGCPTAAWRPNIGEADRGCRSSFGLFLAKECATETFAAAGAVLDGIKGEVLECGATFGYDIKDGSPCGAGAPRFNVDYVSPAGIPGRSFVGGCSHGTQEVLPNGWTRVTFDVCSGAQAWDPIPPGSTITAAILIVDEQGRYTLDNIRVNDVYADKPGAAGPLPECP